MSTSRLDYVSTTDLDNFFDSITDLVLKTLNINFSNWIKRSSLSNTHQFFFQIVQKMHREVVLQTFLNFLSTNESCQLEGVLLIVEGRTQTMLNKENNNYHSTLTLAQCRRMWSIDSFLFLQTKHLFANDHPLFSSLFKVNTFP